MLLSVSTTAILMHCAEETVRRHIRTGKITAQKTSNKEGFSIDAEQLLLDGRISQEQYQDLVKDDRSNDTGSTDGDSLPEQDLKEAMQDVLLLLSRKETDRFQLVIQLLNEHTALQKQQIALQEKLDDLDASKQALTAQLDRLKLESLMKEVAIDIVRSATTQ